MIGSDPFSALQIFIDHKGTRMLVLTGGTMGKAERCALLSCLELSVNIAQT